MNKEISNEDFALIEKLSEEGNVFVDNDNFDAAILKFEAALKIVPAPKNSYEASLWLYASLGDMYFFKQEYTLAKENFYNALNCPDGQVTGFVHLRLGQVLFNLEEKHKALDELLRAYMLEGKEIFENEDGQYLKYLKSNVENIPG
ncbi:tetratricopeptide (TPR) repeat protein [Pedobacter sp. UYP30]|uniref:tetratricopeptide repeat protein n=1 Tax=Pedobacter sp. UYP30 TaxID=1756400 RepID=UPI003393BE47